DHRAIVISSAIGSEGGTVPADDGLRFDYPQSVQHPGGQTIESAQSHSLRGFALQQIELMSQNQNFGLQRSPRPEQSDQSAPDQRAKIAHRIEYQPIRGRRSAVLGLR